MFFKKYALLAEKMFLYENTFPIEKLFHWKKPFLQKKI